MNAWKNKYQKICFSKKYVEMQAGVNVGSGVRTNQENVGFHKNMVD